MDCEHAQEAILDAFDDPRGRVRQREIEAHVASCPACAAFAARQQALDARLGTLLAPPRLSPAFRDTLFQRIRQEPTTPGWLEAMPDILHLASWGVATTASVALLPFDPLAIVGVGVVAAACSYLLLTAVRETLEDAPADYARSR